MSSLILGSLEALKGRRDRRNLPEKQNEDHGKVLAAQAAAALMHECLHRHQKTLGITLDTADFVRHVPTFHVSVSRGGPCEPTHP
jgi:hypothetical protein